jgi:hypothetical protein
MTAHAAIQIEARTKSVGDRIDFLEAGESISEVLTLVGCEALDGASRAGGPCSNSGIALRLRNTGNRQTNE